MKLRKLLVLLLLLSAAFILSACGKQGIQGETGDAGLKGETGAPGDKGPAGDVGDPGAKGEDGANGVGIQFSYGSDGILWRYIGETDWNVGVGYQEMFALLETDKVSFDYYVDPNLSAEAGAPLIAHGNELLVGTTAFKTIKDALTAITAAAGEEGYAGATLYLEAGTYEEEGLTVSANDLTIIGPNANVFAGGEVIRKAEANITKAIAVADGVKNVWFNGLKFSGKGQVTTAAGTTVTNLAFIFNLLEDVTADGTVRIEGTVNNLSVCCNYSESHQGSRFLWLKNVNGLEANCNELIAEAAGSKFDFMNVQGVIKGKVRVIGNTYDYSQQSFIYALGVGVIDAEIAGNTIVGVKNTAIDFRAMSEDGANKFNIHHNVFDQAGCGWCPIRIRVAGYDANDSVAVTVENNAFIDSFYNDNGTPQFVEEPTEDRKIYTIGKNYYSNQGTAITELADANFSGAAATIAETYASEDDITEYELPGDLLPLTKTEQLLADLGAAFVADFNEINDWGLKGPDGIDTGMMDSDQIVTFFTDATLNAKWAWLFQALADANEDNSHDPSAEGFNMAEHKGFYLANLCGFFTQTQHKDTYLGTESMDFTDEALVKTILSAYEG